MDLCSPALGSYKVLSGVTGWFSSIILGPLLVSVLVSDMRQTG